MKKNGCKIKFISCGKFNKKLCIIIVVLISFNVLIGIINILFNYINENYLDNENIINLLSLLFFFNLGEFLMIFPNIILKKKTSSQNDNKSLLKQENNNMVEYIFNQTSINFSKKDKIYLFFFILLKFIVDILNYLYIIFKVEDCHYVFYFNYSFELELIFLFVLTRFMYNVQFYKHQYFSIIVLSVIELVNLIGKNIDKDIGNIIMIIIFGIVLSCLKSMIIIYIKGLMEYKYFSPYKVCYIFGLFNFFLVTILYMIFSFIPCNYIFCKSTYNGTTYLGNILEIFSVSGIFILILFILQAFIEIINYVVIHDLSVCHSFLIIHVTQILDLNKEENTFNKYNDDYVYLYIFLGVFLSVLSTVLILLFLEIIEIHICGLSYNTKKNIEKRAMLDEDVYDINDNDSINSDEEEEKDEKEDEKIALDS